MALTIVSPTAVNTKGAMGSPAFSEFRVTSDVSLEGQQIVVRLGMFMAEVEPVDTSTTFPTNGYIFTLNSANPTTILTPLTTMSPTLRVYHVRATLITATAFTLKVYFLHKADRTGYDTGTINKIHHFEKNAISNNTLLDNSVPSVYNEVKVFRAEVRVFTPAGVQTAIGVYDESYGARWWCNELFDCASLFPPDCVAPTVNNWSFLLFRNFVEVDNLSLSESTTLNINVALATGQTISEFYVAAYKRNGPGTASTYWTDLDFAYARYSPNVNTLANSPFPLGPFQTSPLTFLLASSNATTDFYFVNVPLDAGYFDTPGGEYRFFCVIKHSNGAFYSCLSDIYIADVITPPIDFATTSQIYDYSSANNVYSDCITNVAPGERLKICVGANIASYDAAAQAAGIPGNYYTNFQGIGNRVLDAMPTNYTVYGLEQTYTFTPNNTLSGGCINSLRIPDDWAGTTKYLVFSYVFKITIGTYSYFEYAYHTIAISVAEFSTDLTATFTQGGQPLGNKICQDTGDSPIEMIVTNAQGANFDFIGLIKATGTNNWFEEESYANTNLPQAGIGSITLIDADFTGGDASLQINPELLSLNTEYCIRAIAKEKSVTAPTCAPITIDFTITVGSIIPIFGGASSTIYYSIGWNVTAGAGTITGITINSPATNPVTYTGTGNTGTLTGFYGIWLNSAPLNILFTANISMDNGCTYTTEDITVPGANQVNNIPKVALATAMTTITFN
jgi:hypothetical protein